MVTVQAAIFRKYAEKKFRLTRKQDNVSILIENRVEVA